MSADLDPMWRLEPSPSRTALALLSYICEPGSPVWRAASAGDPEQVVEQVRAGVLGDAVAASAEHKWRGAEVECLLADLSSRGGGYLIPTDPGWPSQLNDLAEPPLGLWFLGSEPLRLLAARSVSVVGARASTTYGQRLALTMSADLAAAGMCVISGGAYGIDAAAHRGAMTAGTTVCVLASGIEVAYPAAHASLFAQIRTSGVIVSEVPPHEPARRFRFLSRNRIIAALSRGTVVVEASLRSGSLGTARRARDIGRTVMAVPGPVTSDASTGCHELLRADPSVVLVTCAADVLEVVGSLGTDAVGWRSGPVNPLDAVSEAAKVVFDYLAEPATPGELSVMSAIPVVNVNAALTELAARSLATRQGERWARCSTSEFT